MRSIHTYTQTDFDLLYLIACAFNRIAPDPALVDAMDLEAVHRLACAHSLEALAALALMELWNTRPASHETMHRWKQAEGHAQYQQVLFETERQAIMAFLDDTGVWHAALKGSVTEGLYPRKDVRQMCDLDILFDPAGSEAVHAWFLARGYEAEVLGNYPVDVYKKPPVFNIEMHKKLISDEVSEPWYSYYLDVADRLVPVAGTRCQRCFTPEDNYVFVIVHAAKHFFGPGTGLRTLADVFAYNSVQGEKLDWGYIRNELRYLGLEAFELDLSCLAQRMFADPERTAALRIEGVGVSGEVGARGQGLVGVPVAEEELLARMFDAGVYGNMESWMRMKVREGSFVDRARVFADKLVPPASTIKMLFPVTERHPVLLPVFYGVRLVRVAASKEKRHRGMAFLRALRSVR